MGCVTWSLGYVSDILEKAGFRKWTWQYVYLQVKSEGGLNASASFVAKANPLIRDIHKRKSELYHALCNMLSNILAPLSDGGKSQWPPSVAEPALTLWYEAVGRIRVQLIQWMEKQSKHLGVRQSDLVSLLYAYLVITVLNMYNWMNRLAIRLWVFFSVSVTRLYFIII